MKEALGRMKDSKEKNMCWQDGRLFEDKEDWVVDSCTKCTCQVMPIHTEICKFTVDLCKLDWFVKFLNCRSPRLCVTKLHVRLWPVPAPL